MFLYDVCVCLDCLIICRIECIYRFFKFGVYVINRCRLYSTCLLIAAFQLVYQQAILMKFRICSKSNLRLIQLVVVGRVVDIGYDVGSVWCTGVLLMDVCCGDVCLVIGRCIIMMRSKIVSRIGWWVTGTGGFCNEWVCCGMVLLRESLDVNCDLVCCWNMW